MAHAPANCSFAGIANITCGSIKTIFLLLNKCVVQAKNHLRSCNLRTYEVHKSTSPQVDFLECKRRDNLQVILLLGQDGSFLTVPENRTQKGKDEEK